MKIPIVSGIYADTDADFRTSYPRNMIPVPKATGLSDGYLRPGDGIVGDGVASGESRGATVWEGSLYRKLGTKLTRISAGGVATDIGEIGGFDRASFAYSFDYLAIASDGKLWLYDGVTLAQNVDPDLGTVLDVIWVDGYFMTTDGEFLVVTELTNPFDVNPFKYGSSEASPDPVVSLLKLRNEVYAVNRFTIEVFQNTGLPGFPFQRILGAQIERGAVGKDACIVFSKTIAFLGGGENESPSVWVGLDGISTKIATREIEEILQTYTDAELAAAVMEVREDRAHKLLYIRLPKVTLVYDAAATAALQAPVWFTLDSGIEADTVQYYAADMQWVYGRWRVAHPETGQYGHFTDDIPTHWGNKITWEFGTPLIYNGGNGAIVHSLELAGLTGRAPLGADPGIICQYTEDGNTYSMPKKISAGKQGDRKKRLAWRRQGRMRNFRGYKFRGDSDAPIAPSRLKARLEPLAH